MAEQGWKKNSEPLAQKSGRSQSVPIDPSLIIDGPPMSSVQWRRDGGIDRISRINFLGEITAEEMHRIILLLVSSLDKGASAGFVALTKVEFIEPDTCEYRYWTARAGDDVAAMIEHIWRRINDIHPVRNIDGTRYSWLRQQQSPSTSAQT